MDRGADATSWRCAAGALQPGQARTFRLEHGGKTVLCFIVNYEGRHYAYVDRCPHAGTPLDLWPNEVFTEDGRHLVCATHGAVFNPTTGICIEGPCPGARLQPLAVRPDGGSLVITWPI